MTANEKNQVWVVGTDGSECARHAALWAVEHAPGRADAVRVTTAWSVPAAPALPPVGPMAPYWDIESYESAAQATVDELAAQLGERLDVPIETIVAEGQSSSVLLSAARHASLLVIGSRGRGGFARLVLGSTSTQCATHATTPTAVIPAESPLERTAKIVVAVDGSENSVEAVRWAVGFASSGTTIECVRVWDATPVTVGADQFFFPDVGDVAREHFFEEMDALTAELDLGGRDIELESTFVEGRIRQELSKAAESADLLVMGARGHGAIGAVLLGSVSTWLLHHVKRPMVIVPHGPDAGTDVSSDHQG